MVGNAEQKFTSGEIEEGINPLSDALKEAGVFADKFSDNANNAKKSEDDLNPEVHPPIAGGSGESKNDNPELKSIRAIGIFDSLKGAGDVNEFYKAAYNIFRTDGSYMKEVSDVDDPKTIQFGGKFVKVRDGLNEDDSRDLARLIKFFNEKDKALRGSNQDTAEAEKRAVEEYEASLVKGKKKKGGNPKPNPKPKPGNPGPEPLKPVEFNIKTETEKLRAMVADLQGDQKSKANQLERLLQKAGFIYYDKKSKTVKKAKAGVHNQHAQEAIDIVYGAYRIVKGELRETKEKKMGEKEKEPEIKITDSRFDKLIDEDPEKAEEIIDRILDKW